ncbi:DUF2155 domain-containing protein [Agrobacterium vitis]|uniref:DUF2155 domain-containing protein n=1 Tax=Agrobacterium vitis TaxID=373 RepID=A0AAE5AXL5_AGRVI|nr:DUF2155 domain-containing protein [Allorhizobium sp. Av2]MCM2441977.1 DUF2155 domain-containing protein [Agrobacterium vitis]MUO81031.1 DUF2155 domain-containing protein [Agrobacterium vitis]MUO96937.1 DUF2155 domain-containing protein [Agrobacterium vitis]MUP06442.1 DUF2155 domain-containing protein [Agrobacterium vitis]
MQFGSPVQLLAHLKIGPSERRRPETTGIRSVKQTKRVLRAVLAATSLTVAFSITATVPADAARISNAVAVFSGLDKITGRITEFDVYINETVQFGALQVTPKACYSRDETEAQHVDAFVQVEEITLDRRIRQIFSGWMFADSPALNAIEHPIYDVWLKDCKQTSDVPKPVK